MTVAKLELQRIIEGLSDEVAEDILDIVLMQLEPATITDEEYAESLRRLSEMKAGNSVRWEDLKQELNL